MAMKRSSSLLLIMLVITSLLSASFGGSPRKLLDVEHNAQIASAVEESRKELLRDEEEFAIHHRILKVHMNDYGSYDPSPAMVKPPFKLIPN